MNRWKILQIAMGIFTSGILSVAVSEGTETEIRCDKSGFATTSVGSRQYAPDRQIEIRHFILDVTPDFKTRSVSGKTTIRFAPIAKSLRELRLNAVDLTISSVESTAKIGGWQVTNEEVIVTFAEPITPGAETTVTFAHRAEPKEGLYFRTPEMGYKEEDVHCWTQGETQEARHWFPCPDYPNQKFTSEVIGHVPPTMTVLSNGKMISETSEPETGLKVVRWSQDKPHANYLIALAAGNFEKVEGKYKDVPIAFYTPRSQIAQAQNSFRDTADMLAFYESEIGVSYPWTKYYQVVVDDFNHGGMENTTLTVLTDRTLFTDATENIRSSTNLVAHELAHQWFGDYVTCKDWSHIWLNEGFATFYAHLYEGHQDGNDAMLYGFWNDAKQVLGAGEDSPKPIVYREYKDSMEQFDFRAYPKGGWILRMLRVQLGEQLYRRCIKTYLERHALGNVVTEDLRAVVEELSGRSYDSFFDQWVYHARYPELEVSYSWSETEKLAKVSVKQTQSVSDKVFLFDLPTKVRFKTKSGAVDREIEIKEKEQDFYFPMSEAPATVRFDPEYGILGKIAFNPPAQMLNAQLEDKSDVMGRIVAIELLKAKKDQETVGRLKAVLNNDPFYGVRVEASKALREIHTQEAFEALATSTAQSDARVRRQVALDLGQFYSDASLAAAKKTLDSEKNPDILAAAIENLGRYQDEGARQLILQFLKSSSYKNALADASIRAIRTLDDPSLIDPLRTVLAEREKEFTSWGFGRGLDTLAYIARNEEKKDAVREFLSARVDHKKRAVQIAAISALGTLKDPKAISVVETFASAGEKDPAGRAAIEAMKSLRDVKKVPVELGDLRSEVMDLKKENEKMKKDLEDVKKKLDAENGNAKKPASDKKRKKILGIF